MQSVQQHAANNVCNQFQAAATKSTLYFDINASVRCGIGGLCVERMQVGSMSCACMQQCCSTVSVN